jgi:hypothetical protein
MNASLPAAVADFLDPFKHVVASANIIDGAILKANASAYVEDALAMIVPTPDIEQAAQQAVLRATVFADKLASVASALPSGNAAKEEARQAALLAIDELRTKIMGAKPSFRATALGLSW